MAKNLLALITAGAIGALSLMLMFSRWHVLRGELDGAPGDAIWKIELQFEGEILAPDGTIKLILPPDFRRQHILEEHFASKELTHKMRHTRDGGARMVVWTSAGLKRPPVPCRLASDFRCLTGMRRPTPGMNLRSRILDSPPADARDFKAGALVESDHEAVTALAKNLAADSFDDEKRVRAWYDYSASLAQGEAISALEALRRQSASAAGKARLLVALCRNRHLAARIVHGLLTTADEVDGLHYWAEVFLDNHWLPMDPARGRFGAERMADEYIVLGFGEDLVELAGASGAANWRLTRLRDAGAPAGGRAPSWARLAWRRMSLSNLRPKSKSG